MNTSVLSGIIVSLVVMTVFVLPLAIVGAILVFVPPERLAPLRRLATRHRDVIQEAPTLSPVASPPEEPSAQPQGDASRSDAPDASRRPHRLGYFVVETTHLERTRLIVETFLERETKSWRLDGSTGYPRRLGRAATTGVTPSTLLYLVRFRRSSNIEVVRDRLQAVGESSDFTVRLECDDDLVARSA